MMNTKFLAAIAITLFATCLPASADIIETFSPPAGINLEAQGTAGGNNGQTGTATVGSAVVNTANPIDGDSLFLSIGTADVPADTAGSFGGFVRIATPVTPSTGPDFTSSSATDYDVVFDMSSTNFTVDNFDVFLQIRDQFNANLIGQISINQNDDVFGSFVDQLDGNGTVVPVSIPLELFTGVDATTDVSALANATRFQTTFQLRSAQDAYSVGPNNVFVVDNFGLTTTAAVPEPGSLSLLALGTVLVSCRRRRA